MRILHTHETLLANGGYSLLEEVISNKGKVDPWTFSDVFDLSIYGAFSGGLVGYAVGVSVNTYQPHGFVAGFAIASLCMAAEKVSDYYYGTE